MQRPHVLRRLTLALKPFLHIFNRPMGAEDLIRITEAPGVVGHGGVESLAREKMEQLLRLGQQYLRQAYLHTKVLRKAL